MRVLIVDDEPLACERIRTLLAGVDGVEIAGEYHDGTSAIAAIQELRPDLVFLDVQMPECNGFAVVDRVARPGAVVPVIIFVTAFDQYAIQAFEVGALDYLLKPFDRERFRKALDRGRAECERRAGGDFGRRLRSALEEWKKASKFTDRLVIKSGGRVFFLRVGEIDWIGAEGNYLRLHAGREEYLHRETMARMEAALDPQKFARIHRSTIVNLEKVKEMHPLFRGDFTVILRDGQKLTLGRAYRGRLKI
jgi:two-component system LytT family response regulator